MTTWLKEICSNWPSSHTDSWISLCLPHWLTRFDISPQCKIDGKGSEEVEFCGPYRGRNIPTWCSRFPYQSCIWSCSTAASQLDIGRSTSFAILGDFSVEQSVCRSFRSSASPNHPINRPNISHRSRGYSLTPSPVLNPTHCPPTLGNRKQEHQPMVTNSTTGQSANPVSFTNPLKIDTISLWKFLLDLLMDKQHKSIIAWTGRQWEFRFIQKQAVAKLWGIRKNKPMMNYDKLSRALRYYYDKNIINKTSDKHYTYYFECDVSGVVGKSYKQVHEEMGISPETDEEYVWTMV